MGASSLDLKSHKNTRAQNQKYTHTTTGGGRLKRFPCRKTKRGRKKKTSQQPEQRGASACVFAESVERACVNFPAFGEAALWIIPEQKKKSLWHVLTLLVLGLQLGFPSFPVSQTVTWINAKCRPRIMGRTGGNELANKSKGEASLPLPPPHSNHALNFIHNMSAWSK